jgi:hypothetical protein
VLSGFTLVRNAIKLDFPIVPAIRSILDVCDEVVVNVGKSDDATRDLVTAIGDPRIRIVDAEWDMSQRNRVLRVETLRAMEACRGSWGIYIQADEVLHEDGARLLRDRVAEWDRDDRVEGLLVRYLHFYGGFELIATNRRWYRREVRCVRLDRDIRPHRDAQGFRVGPDLRRIRARLTDAVMFHYGWARPARAIGEKRRTDLALYPWRRVDGEANDRPLEWIPLLRRFAGPHPAAAAQWMAERSTDPARVIGPRRLRPAHVRLYLSDAIERVTGARLFEYRNYDVV